MAIDLPPIPPEQVTLTELRSTQSNGSTVSAKIGNFRATVVGNRHLPNEDIQSLLSNAPDLSAAVRLLSAALTEAGYPASRVLYSLHGQILHIAIVDAQVAVNADEQITSFISVPIDEKPIRQNHIERDLILAESLLQRGGETLKPEWDTSASDKKQVTLNLGVVEDPEYDPWSIDLKFGNPGNRFLGRYLGEVAVNGQFRNGREVSLSWQKIFPGLGQARNGKRYDGIGLKASQVFSFGVIGIGAKFTEYVTEFAGQRQDAEGSQLELNGLHVVYGDRNKRLTFQEKLVRVESKIDDSVAGQIQDESYTAFEFGINFAHRPDFWLPIEYEMAILPKGGLSGQKGTLFEGAGDDGLKNPDFRMLRLAASIRTLAADADSSYWSLTTSAQLSNSLLPEMAKWVLGGLGGIRAWLPGALVGDAGLFAELRYRAGSITIAGQDIHPSVYLEHGTARFTEGVVGRNTSNLTDAGIEVSGEFVGINLAINAAFPIDEDVADEDALDDLRSEFYFTISKRF